MDLRKIKDQIGKLSPSERSLLILWCLEEGIFDYTEISKQYTKYLENKSNQRGRVISKAAQWLTTYWQGGKMSKGAFVQAGVTYWLLKHAGMGSAPIGKDMQEFLDEHPYDEDENGFPITKVTHVPVKKIQEGKI